MKTFNTTGCCIPELHYMVNIEDKLRQMKRLVDQGYYFVINRARQYGKTTTLELFETYLQGEYSVVSLDFQSMSSAQFCNEKVFCGAFVRMFYRTVQNRRAGISELDHEPLKAMKKASECGMINDLGQMFEYLSEICGDAPRPVVLMIDEVDSASNNQVFLDFLAQLRSYYLRRSKMPAFHSVVLAGVYDIKNLKLKIRPESEHKYNSPWNIAEPFDVDMSFSVQAIAGMLTDYENDHHTGMDINAVSQYIYDYTSGYPFLVSYICKTIDSKISVQGSGLNRGYAWSRSGVTEAVKVILKEGNIPLFESMVKQLDIYPALRSMIEGILYQGRQIPFSPDVEAVSIGLMFGFLKEKESMVVVSNRIFEMRLLNMFITEEASENEAYQSALRSRNQFVQDNHLNMDLVFEKFVEHYTDVYSDNDQKFVEKYGRKILLMYLKPIINGVGNYYVEAETRDMERTDIVVDYLGEQFVIECKIWHGQAYTEKGEQQLSDYLDRYHLKKGYLLIFSFNKKKTASVKRTRYGNKVLVEAVV